MGEFRYAVGNGLVGKYVAVLSGFAICWKKWYCYHA